MPTPRRWPLAVRRPLAVLAGCAVMVGLAGCANDKEQRLAQLERGRGRDPLLGEKIPSPNVPTGRDQYGVKDGRDPLLRADAGGFDPTSRDGANEPLRIPDRRPGGVSTARGLSLGSSATADQMTADLQQIGAKVLPAVRTESGSYEVRVMVPNPTSGAMSGYVGGGATATAALRDAYDQVRSAK